MRSYSLLYFFRVVLWQYISRLPTLTKQMCVNDHLATADVGILWLITPKGWFLSFAESPVVCDNFFFVGADSSLGFWVSDDSHVTVASGNVSSLGSRYEGPMRIIGQVRRFRVGPLFCTNWTPFPKTPASTVAIKSIDKAHLKRQQIFSFP